MIAMSLSEARHQFNQLPKRLREDGNAIVVEDKGDHVMAICSMDQFVGLSAAMQFIHDKELEEAFEDWMKELQAEAEAHHHVHGPDCNHDHGHTHEHVHGPDCNHDH